MKRVGMILIAATIPLAFAAAQNMQSGQNDRFTGTWKLNLAKSKFDPGPVPKSVTVMLEPGKASVEEVTQDGKTVNWSFNPSEGTPVPINGMQDSTVVEKRINDRTVEHTWKMGAGNYTGKAVLSKSGKVMTYTLDGTDAQGRHVHNVEIYDKQ